ncbi:MAG: GNAT family N-acetyltransferase [Candidatus Limnocylindria bacterium]
MAVRRSRSVRESAFVVRRAARSEKPVIRRLLELYQYDLSRIDGRELDHRARYGYHYLEHYWRERGRFPYLIQVDGHWAGMALVNKHSPIGGADWSMAEFFVLPPYRRRRIGERVARWLFDQHPGKWHVAHDAENREAQRFWRAVLTRYTAGRLKEVSVRDQRWTGHVQIFTSPPRGKLDHRSPRPRPTTLVPRERGPNSRDGQ